MFYKSIHQRIKYVFVIITIILLIVVLRVFYIQIFKYDELNNLANDLWQRNLPIKAERGIIFDRKGKILATNITTVSLVLIPNQIKNPELVAKDISSILQVDYDDIYQHVTKKLLLKEFIPKEEV